MSDFADISHHQSVVNLSVYKASGHDRFALKATEDTGFVDSAFANRWTEGGRLGLARMPYHFLRNHSGGADQFRHFNGSVPPLTSRDILVLDVEDIDTPGDAAAQTVAFCNTAAAAGYTRGIIYTYRFYANDRHITAGMLPPGWRQLWLADYKSAVLDKDIVLPFGWTRSQVVARQFTDNAIVPGITGPSDYNRVYRDWLAAAPPVTPPTTGDSDVTTVPEVRDIAWSAVRAGLTGHNNGEMPVAVTGADLQDVGVPAQLAAMETRLGTKLSGIEAHMSGVHDTLMEIRDLLAASPPPPPVGP